MTGPSLDLAQIERRIALVRANIAELVEQAAAYSGAADDELASQRIAELETELKNLTAQQRELSRKESPKPSTPRRRR